MVGLVVGIVETSVSPDEERGAFNSPSDGRSGRRDQDQVHDITAFHVGHEGVGGSIAEGRVGGGLGDGGPGHVALRRGGKGGGEGERSLGGFRGTRRVCGVESGVFSRDDPDDGLRGKSSVVICAEGAKSST